MKILKRLYSTAFTVILLTASLTHYALGQTPPAPSTPARPQGSTGRTGTPQVSRVQPTNLEANGGSMADGVYTNSIYGFSMKTPPGWVIVPRQDALPAKAQAENPALKPAQINHTLLVATENEPLRRSSERKSIQVIATHMINALTPTAARDYLIYSRDNAKAKGMAVEYLGDPQPVTIHGVKLWKVASNEEIEGRPQHVEQYVIVRESTLLQFFLVSPTEPGLKEIEPVIQSLKFKALTQKQGAKRTSKAAKDTTSTDTQK